MFIYYFINKYLVCNKLVVSIDILKNNNPNFTKITDV